MGQGGVCVCVCKKKQEDGKNVYKTKNPKTLQDFFFQSWR